MAHFSMTLADRVAAVAVAMLAAASPQALGADDARALAAGCRSCHQGDTVIPPLDDQARDALLGKLRGFRDGTLPGTVMPELVKGYTAAQLEAIAGYLARGGRH
jgi:sulfide dehydrogenase cytochrome subunit